MIYSISISGGGAAEAAAVAENNIEKKLIALII
jgi:hypothetical protein